MDECKPLVPGGVLARVQPPSRWSVEWGADGTHAHLCCANNLPEVAVQPSTTSAPVIDITRVKNSRMALQCGLCGLSGGCVQCSMAGPTPAQPYSAPPRRVIPHTVDHHPVPMARFFPK